MSVCQDETIQIDGIVQPIQHVYIYIYGLWKLLGCSPAVVVEWRHNRINIKIIAFLQCRPRPTYLPFMQDIISLFRVPQERGFSLSSCVFLARPPCAVPKVCHTLPSHVFIASNAPRAMPISLTRRGTTRQDTYWTWWGVEACSWQRGLKRTQKRPMEANSSSRGVTPLKCRVIWVRFLYAHLVVLVLSQRYELCKFR